MDSSQTYWLNAVLPLVWAVAMQGSAETQLSGSLPKAIKAWREFDRMLYSTVVGQIRMAGNQGSEQQATVKALGEQQLLIRMDNIRDDGDSEIVLVKNPQYGFELNRKKDGNWKIVQIIARSNDEQTFHESLRMDKDSIFVVGISPASIYNGSLLSITAEESCHVVSETLLDNGHVALTLRLGEGILGEFYRHVETIELELDPNNYWLPVRSKVSERNGIVTERDNYFDGNVLPVRAISKMRFPNGLEKESTFTYDWTINEARARPGEFRLAAFGLPEPGWVHHQPIRWQVIVAATAAVVIISGFLVFRFRKPQIKSPHKDS